jgi:glycosyltransferase involved in cell wall biosynthesis
MNRKSKAPNTLGESPPAPTEPTQAPPSHGLTIAELARAMGQHAWPSGYVARLRLCDDELYERIHLEGLTLNFHLAALQDRRGIGRHARELLREFRARAALPRNAMDTSRAPEVFLYTTVHWCPATLPGKACVVIHDVIPLLFPELFAESARQWTTRHLGVARQAARIVTISETSRDDIARALNLPVEAIDVVPNGVSALPLAQFLGVETPDQPYVVFLGEGDAHKNLDVILRALDLAEEFSLVCIGQPARIHASLAALPKATRNRVRVMGYLEDGQITHLLSNALALVFPSLYEGFGLPPFEAALLGVPSICSDRPAMNQLLRSAAVFCHAQRPEEWVAAMRTLHRDPPYRASLVTSARALAETFTWRGSADGLEKVLRSLPAG